MESIAVIVAAVVALIVVILGFITVYPINEFPPSTIGDEAGYLIKTQINRPGELRTSSRVNLSNRNSVNSKSIAADSGVILPSQICISKGEHADTPGLALSDSASNSILTYSNPRIVVKFSLLCDTGSSLRADLTKNGLPAEWMDASPQCQAIAQSEQTGCIVALRYA